MFKLGAALLVGVALAVTALVAVPAEAEASGPTATFTKTSDWGTGFVGEYQVTNGGPTTLQGWTLEFDLPTGAQVTSAWNARMTSAGPHVVFLGEAWTNTLAPGDQVKAGFQVAVAASTAVVPLNCQLNGRPCGADPTTSTTIPVTVPPTFVRTSDWGTGYIGEYTIRNGSTAPLVGWKLEFDLPTGQARTGLWGGTVTATGRHQVVTPESWNRTIAAGATVKVGFQATRPATFVAPTGCLFNGASCLGSVPPTTVPPTTVPPTTTPTTTVPTGGGSGATTPGFVPYVDMTLSSDSLAAVATSSGVRRLTLGFVVSGAPCQASWGGYYGLDDPTIKARIDGLVAAGGGAIVSFGGAANQELARTCTSVSALAAQYQAVIDRYGLRDLDFEVEASDQTDAVSLERRFEAVAQVQAAGLAAGRPVRVSLTLPVLPTGLTAAGVGVVRAAVANGVDVGTVNVMAMDYFDPSLAPYAGKLGGYAIQAATAVKGQLAAVFPGRGDAALWRTVGVTPMLGINDNPAEVFTTADAAQLTTFARQKGLGRLSMWSINRDKPCGRATTWTENSCSGVADPAWAFSAAFLPFGT